MTVPAPMTASRRRIGSRCRRIGPVERKAASLPPAGVVPEVLERSDGPVGRRVAEPPAGSDAGRTGGRRVGDAEFRSR